MGYSACQAKSLTQLARMIQAAAKASKLVIVTVHAEKQMKARKIIRPEVDTVLARGLIRRAPEANDDFGTLECRMEAYVAGRNLGVIVAVSDDDPSLVIVTAMVVGS